MDDYIKTELIKSGRLNLFEKLAPSHQNEYLKWINQAKKVETKQLRVAKMIEMLNQKSSK